MKLLEDWLKKGTVKEYIDFLLRNQIRPYRGRERVKSPIDDAHYEDLMQKIKPDAVLELGCRGGGSTLWYLDRLRIYSEHRNPIAVGVDVATTDEQKDNLILLKGDFLEHSITKKIYELLDGFGNILVIEDAAHSYECSISAFKLYSSLVPVGGYYIMEDIIVQSGDIIYTGVEKACLEVAALPDWEIDRTCEKWGLTFHPKGWLKRIK